MTQKIQEVEREILRQLDAQRHNPLSEAQLRTLNARLAAGTAVVETPEQYAHRRALEIVGGVTEEAPAAGDAEPATLQPGAPPWEVDAFARELLGGNRGILFPTAAANPFWSRVLADQAAKDKPAGTS